MVDSRCRHCFHPPSRSTQCRLRSLPALLLITALASCASASSVNRTIDDQTGDSVTGVVPTYSPPAAWKQGATCDGCFIKLDPDHVLGGTWHDATHSPNDAEPLLVTAQFTGTAVWARMCTFRPRTLRFSTTCPCTRTRTSRTSSIRLSSRRRVTRTPPSFCSTTSSTRSPRTIPHLRRHPQRRRQRRLLPLPPLPRRRQLSPSQLRPLRLAHLRSRYSHQPAQLPLFPLAPVPCLTRTPQQAATPLLRLHRHHHLLAHPPRPSQPLISPRTTPRSLLAL
ncbi:hypothetical protein L227DRAFT_263205 [Lentinus tigrinus ALCF2SS1-6]|uniref:Uncharacterized protein n=1 Tax=Lentinus tigrinus ALCF2SS1-6 TaxID=1328759 RepID=A0A5C2SLK3_9APHY|nr:hypothetical protein L227DRAFT_263205 [Lentinus tigrinus ALCF2SS1-6]